MTTFECRCIQGHGPDCPVVNSRAADGDDGDYWWLPEPAEPAVPVTLSTNEETPQP